MKLTFESERCASAQHLRRGYSRAQDGWTPLLNATKYGHLEVVDALLAAGALGSTRLQVCMHVLVSTLGPYFLIEDLGPELIFSCYWQRLFSSTLSVEIPFNH